MLHEFKVALVSSDWRIWLKELFPETLRQEGDASPQEGATYAYQGPRMTPEKAREIMAKLGG
jgi:hypothetical protein